MNELTSSLHNDPKVFSVLKHKLGSIIGAPAAFCAHKQHETVSEPTPGKANHSPLPDLKRAQRQDKFLDRIIYCVKNGKKFDGNLDKNHPWFKIVKRNEEHFKYDKYGLLCLEKDEHVKQVIPEANVPTYLKHAHSIQHVGRARTQFALRQFWWPSKYDDIRNFIRSCTLCSARKGRYGQSPIKSGVTDKGSKFMDVLYLDFVSMDPKNGKSKVLTVQDGFTRYMWAFASARDTAEDAARGLYSVIVETQLIPRKVSSDRGRHFVNSTIKTMCETLGMSQKLHVPYNPTSSGTKERFHRLMKGYLAMAANET